MLNKPMLSESSANVAGIFAGSSHCNSNTHSSAWIVDSGATDHMVSNKALLNHGLSVSHPGKVQLPTGDSAVVTHSGSSQLTGGDVVKNVLCVPTFQFNLLSVSKLTKELNCCVVFFPDFFIIQDLFTGKVKEIGEEIDGLYITRPHQHHDKSKKALAAVKGCAEAETWHKRLGHIPMSVLRKIKMFDSPQKLVLPSCDVCPLARQVRLPFPISQSRSENCFDLIHLDVWGPYKAATHNKMRYFLTVVDDHSRWTWIFLMHLKSDVSTVLQNFILMINTQFG